MKNKKNNLSLQFKLLVTTLLIATYFLYDMVYIVIDEYFMDVPSCNLSKDLKENKIPANAGCLIIQDDKILLVRDYKSKTYSIPAGTSNRDEIAACTAHRETFEESGVNVKILKRLSILDNGFNIFLCEPISEIDLKYQKKYEIDEVVLKEVSEIKNYKYPKQLSVIKQLLHKN